ncbi:stalk domain-containing protein [Anaerotignum sp.]
MKKIKVLIVATLILLGMNTVAMADSGIKIKVGGNLLLDAEAILKGGRTLLPVRSVSNALGGEVIWDAATKTVEVTKGGTNVVMTVGAEYIIVKGENVIHASVPAQVINGRTYVPLRALGEALDCEIVWINETKTVEINEKIEGENIDFFKKNIPYFLIDKLYLTEGEVVPVPVSPSGASTRIQWSNDNIKGDWSSYYYNEEEVVFVTGVNKGSASLKIYNDYSKKSTVQGDNTEIRVYVVDEDNENYKKQKEERIEQGYDILANQAGLIAKEERVKEKYELYPMGIQDVTYVETDSVLIIPIHSNTELTGHFDVKVKERSGLEAVVYKYNNMPAIFINTSKITSTDVIIRYSSETDSKITYSAMDSKATYLVREESDNPDILLEREEIRNNAFYDSTETAAWSFKLKVVNSGNAELQKQEKERIEQGISYDMYLNGQA